MIILVAGVHSYKHCLKLKKPADAFSFQFKHDRWMICSSLQ